MSNFVLRTFNVDKGTWDAFDILLKQTKKHDIVDKATTKSSILRDFIIAVMHDWTQQLIEQNPNINIDEIIKNEP